MVVLWDPSDSTTLTLETTGVNFFVIIIINQTLVLCVSISFRVGTVLSNQVVIYITAVLRRRSRSGWR